MYVFFFGTLCVCIIQSLKNFPILLFVFTKRGLNIEKSWSIYWFKLVNTQDFKREQI